MSAVFKSCQHSWCHFRIYGQTQGQSHSPKMAFTPHLDHMCGTTVGSVNSYSWGGGDNNARKLNPQATACWTTSQLMLFMLQPEGMTTWVASLPLIYFFILSFVLHYEDKKKDLDFCQGVCILMIHATKSKTTASISDLKERKHFW